MDLSEDGTGISYKAFATPSRGACALCSNVKCGREGGVKAIYRGHAEIEQVGARCVAKIIAAQKAFEAEAKKNRRIPAEPKLRVEAVA